MQRSLTAASASLNPVNGSGDIRVSLVTQMTASVPADLRSTGDVEFLIALSNGVRDMAVAALQNELSSRIYKGRPFAHKLSGNRTTKEQTLLLAPQ